MNFTKKLFLYIFIHEIHTSCTISYFHFGARTNVVKISVSNIITFSQKLGSSFCGQVIFFAAGHIFIYFRVSQSVLDFLYFGTLKYTFTLELYAGEHISKSEFLLAFITITQSQKFYLRSIALNKILL